jgi:hypothetical protein
MVATAALQTVVEVIFNGMASLLHLIKIYQLVQKLIGRRDTQTG